MFTALKNRLTRIYLAIKARVADAKARTISQSEEAAAKVLPHPRDYLLLWLAGWIIVFGIAFGGASALMNDSLLKPYFHPYVTALLLALVYLVPSLRMVRENQVAGTFSYGKPLVKLDPGLHFAPWGLMQLIFGPRPVMEFQCPDEPENVQKGDDKIPLDEGKVRPIRIVTGNKPIQGQVSGDDPLNSRMTIVLSFFVQWVIDDVLSYASNYGSRKEVEKQLRDIGEALLAEKAVEHSPASFIDSLKEINAHLTAEMQRRFKNSGVRIISTRLVSPDISHEVSESLASIPKAEADKRKTIIDASAAQIKLTKEGEGRAAAELAMLTARAKGRKANMKALKVTGDAVLASDTVRDVLKETDVLVVGAEGGMRDAMSLVKGAQSAFQSGKKEVTSS